MAKPAIKKKEKVVTARAWGLSRANGKLRNLTLKESRKEAAAGRWFGDSVVRVTLTYAVPVKEKA